MNTAFPLENLLFTPGVLIDVRSPAEYAKGHIPTAHNIPLFTDGERAAVGKSYKQVGAQAAAVQGLSLIGPNLSTFLEKCINFIGITTAKLYCWRGGMRSNSVSMLLRAATIDVSTIQGGYKAFRRWALTELSLRRNIVRIGGMTGSGKTAILHQLRHLGAQTLDLEALACHRGSAFGALPDAEQPTAEQFENEIALQLRRMDPSAPIWVEDESRLIGRCKIPDSLFNMMQEAPLHLIECPLDQRMDRLRGEYANLPKQHLCTAVLKLQKKLGTQRTSAVIAQISSGDYENAMIELLRYYDRSYSWHREQQRPPICYRYGESSLCPKDWAERILNRTFSGV